MANQWNQGNSNLAAQLGQLAIRAQGVIIAQRLCSVQRMVAAQTRELRKLPGGQRKLEEAQQHIDAVKQIIKDDPRRG